MLRAALHMTPTSDIEGLLIKFNNLKLAQSKPFEAIKASMSRAANYAPQLQGRLLRAASSHTSSGAVCAELTYPARASSVVQRVGTVIFDVFDERAQFGQDLTVPWMIQKYPS